MFRKILMLVLCSIFLGTQLSFAEIAEENLLSEIRALKEQVEKQEQRIDELEQRLAQQGPKDFDAHVDSHLLHRKEGYYLTGGLKMGAGY